MHLIVTCGQNQSVNPSVMYLSVAGGKSVSKPFSNVSYNIDGFYSSVNPSVITEGYILSVNPLVKRAAKFSPFFFLSLCMKKTIFLSLTNEFHHFFFPLISKAFLTFSITFFLSCATISHTATTAVREPYPCRWRAPPLLFESTTAIVGEYHRCCWRVQLLPLENATATIGEHNRCHGRTPLLSWENHAE